MNSAPGRGTSFRLYFPRVYPRVINEGESRAETPAIQPREQTGRGTILLVEDREDVRGLVREMLEADGYSVLHAPTAEDAMDLSAGLDNPIDLLLTDVVMTGMTGKELARRLSIVRPAMKVLYMSGYTENAIAHRGVLQPGISYIQKPMTSADLSSKVRETLGCKALVETVTAP